MMLFIKYSFNLLTGAVVIGGGRMDDHHSSELMTFGTQPLPPLPVKSMTYFGATSGSIIYACYYDSNERRTMCYSLDTLSRRPVWSPSITLEGEYFAAASMPKHIWFFGNQKLVHVDTVSNSGEYILKKIDFPYVFRSLFLCITNNETHAYLFLNSKNSVLVNIHPNDPNHWIVQTIENEHSYFQRSCLFFQNKLFLTGGYFYTDEGTITTSNNVAVYDAVDLTLRFVTTMDIPRSGHGMIVFNNAPTVIGGVQYKDGQWKRLNSTEQWIEPHNSVPYFTNTNNMNYKFGSEFAQWQLSDCDL